MSKIPDPITPKWYAVYTRYKREKLVRQRLEEKGVQVYLPLQRFKRYYVRKVKTVDLPLISCYIFVCINKAYYVPVLETADVVQFIKFNNQLSPIPQREIDIMRMVTGEELEVEAVPRQNLRPGDRVEIISGRLTGLTGHLLEGGGNKNFLVDLESVGYSLQLEVPKEALRQI